MTTADKDKVKSPLPVSLMRAIKATTEAADIPPQDKLEAVVLIANGYGLFSQNETVDPTAYAIPAKQWMEISEMLMNAYKGDPIESVNVAMDWMNYGPSGYDE